LACDLQPATSFIHLVALINFSLVVIALAGLSFGAPPHMVKVTRFLHTALFAG
jgi:hypothetical protein